MTLPLDGDPTKQRVVAFSAKGYSVSMYDGDKRIEHSEVAFSQATNPLNVGKRWIQIIDLRHHLPNEIRLVSTKDGPRIARLPVSELDVLHGKSVIGTRSLAQDGENPLAALHAQEFDVQTKFRPGKSTVTFRIRGVDVTFEGATETLKIGRQAFKVPLVGNEFEFRMMTLESDVEVFIDGGRIYLDWTAAWKKDDTISVHVAGDPVLFRWLDVFELRSPDVLGKGPAPDITKETFGVTPVAESKEPSGFVIAGKNSTDSLAKLAEIHGRKIAALEFDMRPGALARAGFLGDKEKLLDVLVDDNRTVVDKLGRSHTELAMPLRILGTYAQEKATKEPIEFVYRGHRFQARAEIAKAHIESPFEDGLSTNVSVTLWNLDNGKSLTYSMMVPHLIERYGFYEGHGTSYRVEPSDIVEVLELSRQRRRAVKNSVRRSESFSPQRQCTRRLSSVVKIAAICGIPEGINPSRSSKTLRTRIVSARPKSLVSAGISSPAPRVFAACRRSVSGREYQRRSGAVQSWPRHIGRLFPFLPFSSAPLPRRPASAIRCGSSASSTRSPGRSSTTRTTTAPTIASGRRACARSGTSTSICRRATTRPRSTR